jgi:general secretion pathway protein L
MPKTILGVQLGPATALAVHLKWGWKSAIVERVYRIDRPGGDPETRGVALLEADLPHTDSVIAALPADAVFQRLVELPFADRTKVEQAAPLEAEESLPWALEDLVCHVHVLERKSGHSKVLLVAATEERLAESLAELRHGGLEPQIVDVEPMALAAVAYRSLPANRSALVIDLSQHLCQGVLLGPGGPWSFYAFSAGSADPALRIEVARYLSRWEGTDVAPDAVHLSGPDALQQDLGEWRDGLGLPVEILPLPHEGVSLPRGGDIPWPGWAIPLGLALREGQARAASQINMLQGPFAPSRETGPWKKTVVLAGVYLGVLLTLWGVGAWSESSHQQTQYGELKEAVRAEFRRAMPDVTGIVDGAIPSEMRRRVEELENRASILGSLADREVSTLRILREISARLPKNLEVEFEIFAVEEGRVRLEGITTSFDAIDKIKADLAGYPRFASVTVSDAKTDVRDKVKFKLAIVLGRKG